jgi:hypothetical protein
MPEIITNRAVFWGGFNPEIANFIKISMKEIFRNAELVTFEIMDTILEEKEIISDDDEKKSTYFVPYCVTRHKQIAINSSLYDELYRNSNAYIDKHFPNKTTFEKDNMRPEVALLISFTNSLLENGKCGYNTSSNDWTLLNF